MSEQPFKGMILAPLAEDLSKSVLKRAKSINVPESKNTLTSLIALEKTRIRYIGETTFEKLRKVCFSIPRFSELHPFYREWASLLINVDDMRRKIAHIYTVAKIILKVSREESFRLRYVADAKEVKRIKRRFIARYFSLLDDISRDLEVVRKYQLILIKLQAIDPTIKTVVVAGPPNVGKSSLVRVLSKAKPEVREYPFTTKELTIGHIELNGEKIQITDTPGLLDRPLEERNPIERKAILAIKYLASIILFLIDPSEYCGFNIDYQVNVLKSVLDNFPNVPLIVVFNKIDVASKSKISEASKRVMEIGYDSEIIQVSALKKTNISLLLEIIKSYLKNSQ